MYKSVSRPPWRTILCTLFLLFPFVGKSQTDIVVSFQSGAANQTFTIQPSGKLYFRGDTLFLAQDDASAALQFPLSIIRKIYFVNNPSAVRTLASESAFTISPNPVNDQFFIQAADSKKLSVRLFNLAGREMLQGSYLPGEPIAVSHLASGLYILTVNDHPFKLLKK